MKPSSEAPLAPPTPSLVASAEPSLAPSATPAASLVVAAPPAGSSEAATPSSSPSAQAAEETLVSIDTVPPRATILVGGVKRGVSPLELRFPKSSEPLTVEIRHPGYAALRERVVPNVHQRLKLTLTPAPRVPPPASGRPYHKFE